MKKIGTKIDALRRMRDKRIALSRQVDEQKRKERELEAEIVAQMKAEKLAKCSGNTATFSFASQTVAKVTDWEAFYAWIQETGNFDLLERRVSHKSYRAHLEDDDAPDGVAPDQVLKISLTSL